MTYKEVTDLLIATGLPVTYLMWPEKEAPDLPYICYYYPSSNDESADNINWAHITALNVELYTRNKDFSIESQVESVLTASGFFFAKSESYLDNEHMYEVLYEMEVCING